MSQLFSGKDNGGETSAVLLKSELTHLGYKVFLDFDDLPIGGDFLNRIEDIIGSSYLFLFLYSFGCLNRCDDPNDTLRKEIECAVRNEIQILTLNVNLASKYYRFPPKNKKIPNHIIEALCRHNFLDFFTGQYKQDSLNRLAEFMATELGKNSLGFQKKVCTLALLSEIDSDFVIDGVEWTALRANTIKHIQIGYGEYKNVQFRPIGNFYYGETQPISMIIATPMKEIQVNLEDFPQIENDVDDEIIVDIEKETPEEIRERGWDYQLNQEPQKAIKCWKIAANLGDSAAQYSLGYQYSKGEFLPKDDVKAFEWYLIAAKQGDSRAQFLLGDAYYYGSGTRRNFKQAVVWYEKSANQGNAKALYSLGCCYHKGNGIERDDTKAFQLFLKSAEQGYHNAELLVARFYNQGIGVEIDLNKALQWYEKSAEHGSETAKLYCKRMQNRQ